jgi:P-type Cu2+ transporter
MEDRKDPDDRHMHDMSTDANLKHMHHDMEMGGHGGGPPSGHTAHHAHMAEDFRKRFWVSLIITVPILILSPMIQQFLGLDDKIRFTGDAYLLFALSTVIFFYGGSPFLTGLIDELKNRQPGMMTLIGVAITTAYAYSSAVVFGLRGMSFFWELATLIDIMLLGHWIEMKSVLGASKALEELGKLMPSEAHRIMPDGSVEDVPVSSLSVSDRVIIKPGEKIPSDGEVTEGESSVNESMLTGESKPVSKRSGAQVIGGSINAEGSLTVHVTRTGEDSFLSQLINLVREAQQSRSRSQDLANRVATWLTVIALSGGLITLVAWLAFFGQSLYFGMERAVTVMVISCPHALGLAVPLVVAVSTALAARSGLLIRNREAFERARGIQAIVFDKTGTLTEGKFGITDVVLLSDETRTDELLRYAASVESRSEHPIAKALASSSGDIPSVQDFRAIPGKGAQGKVEGKDVKVVSPGYLRENGIALSNRKELDALASQGKTIVFVLIDGIAKGAVALADIIRPESKEAISRLKAMGIRCMMLTGDNRQVAQWVSQEIGLDEYFAEVLPQDKAAKIKAVKERGMVTAMTGDGVNDAPALAQADVGIAIGAGTDVAIETADIILVKSNPLDVVSMIGLAKATYRKMAQNLAWAAGYNIVAIPLAAGVLYKTGILLTPAMGAVLMSLSTVIVAINARFLRAD